MSEAQTHGALGRWLLTSRQDIGAVALMVVEIFGADQLDSMSI